MTTTTQTRINLEGLTLEDVWHVDYQDLQRENLQEEFASTTPHLEDQRKLLEHPWEDVRRCLGHNTNLHLEIQEALLKDTSMVRKGLTFNRGLAPHVTQALLDDVEAFVRAHAVWLQELTGQQVSAALEDPEETVRAHLALRDTLPPEAQLKLAEDKAHIVTSFLAQREDLTSEAQDHMIEHGDHLVHASLLDRLRSDHPLIAKLSLAADFRRDLLLEKVTADDLHEGYQGAFAWLVSSDWVLSRDPNADQETLRSIGPNWRGTVKTLIEASKLV